MRESDLARLLENNKELDRRIDEYLAKNLISRVEPGEEINGHMAKAEHNLDFANRIAEEFNDWVLVACYYASYHISLALILTKGYLTKNHDATLCLLVKHFCKKGISEEDLRWLNKLDSQDVLFYVQSKQQREMASYSSRLMFDRKLVSEMKLKTRLFIGKVKEIIIQQYSY